MRRLFKIIVVFSIIIMSQISFTYATDQVNPKSKDGSYTDTGTGIHSNSSKTETNSNSSNWSDKGILFWKPRNMGTGVSEINDGAKIIIAAIRNIGIVISVVALIVIGIKQVISSAEEKSILKEAMPGYILGLILVVSITFLPTIIYDFITNLNQ